MTRRFAGRPSPYALIQGAVSLAAIECLSATDTQSAALLLACQNARHTLTLAYIPSGATWELQRPATVPSEKSEREGVTLASLGGACLTFEYQGRRTVLDVPSVRIMRELLEALTAYDSQRLQMEAVS